MNDTQDKQATRSAATNGIAVRLQRMFRRFFAPKPKRLELKLATYSEAEGLLKQGWTLAPEEDRNHAFGLVYLERLETPNDELSDAARTRLEDKAAGTDCARAATQNAKGVREQRLARRDTGISETNKPKNT